MSAPVPGTPPRSGETVASLPGWAQKLIGDLRSESAGHRQSAADLKAERDALRTEANERAASAALAGLSDVLTDPSDLTRFVDSASLLGDDGKPDPGKYLEAAQTLVSERPHLGPRVASAGGAPLGGVGPYQPAGSDGVEADVASGRSAFVDLFQSSE